MLVVAEAVTLTMEALKAQAVLVVVEMGVHLELLVQPTQEVEEVVQEMEIAEVQAAQAS